MLKWLDLRGTRENKLKKTLLHIREMFSQELERVREQVSAGFTKKAQRAGRPPLPSYLAYINRWAKQ